MPRLQCRKSLPGGSGDPFSHKEGTRNVYLIREVGQLDRQACMDYADVAVRKEVIASTWRICFNKIN